MWCCSPLRCLHEPASVPDVSPALASLEAALASFSEVPPSLLAERALLQRVDRKYVMRAGDVGSVVARLSDTSGVLRAGGALLARYRTLYFDTEDLTLYDDHRRGRPERCKVRIRHHVDRQMSFVEVKRRTAVGRSLKFVLPQPFGITALDEEARSFIERHCVVKPAELRARAWVTFRRLTLVGYGLNERMTFDCDFEYGDGRRRERWASAAIVEVKQGRRSNESPSVVALRDVGAKEQSISKYCVATARLSGVRGGAFKPAVRALLRTGVAES